MDPVKIGNFISSLRREKGMTQEMLGESLGVTNKTISRWENGNYMPKIEMFKTLSELFGVSVNELLCGERIAEGEFREKADENLISAFESFSKAEKFSFWRKKWLRDHIFVIIVCFVLLVGSFVLSYLKEIDWLAGASIFAGVVLYMFFTNSMMAYIEDKIYK